MDNKIGSGRTSRLIHHAITLAKQGTPVVIMAGTEAHARDIRKLVGPHRITVITHTHGMNWEAMRHRSYLGSVLLVDHFAIEKHFATMLEMLHRYDLENCSPESEYWAGIAEKAR